MWLPLLPRWAYRNARSTVRTKNSPAIQVVKRTSTLVAGPMYCSTIPEANAVPKPSLRGRCNSTTSTSKRETIMCIASKKSIR